MKRREKHEEKSEKQNQKDVAGMMLACSLLTLFGGVSSDGIATCTEVVIENEM